MKKLVPLSDIIPANESLSTTFLPDELPILNYFESSWIRLAVGRQRMAPSSPHAMWNVDEMLSSNEIRVGTSFLHSVKERKRNERVMKLVSEYSLPQADRLLRVSIPWGQNGGGVKVRTCS